MAVQHKSNSNFFKNLCSSFFVLPSKKKEKGFTLIEIVVAVIILGLAYVAVLQNFSISMKNILRVEKSRTRVFEQMLAFEDELHITEEEEEEEEMSEQDFPIFLEGSIYAVVVVTDEDEEFVSLRLEKI